MEPSSSAEQQINRIERELDAKAPPAAKPAKRKQDAPAKGGESSKFLHVILVSAVLLIGVSTAFFAADRMSRDQRIQWTAGSIREAIGLLVGYGVGRLRP